MTPWTLGVDLGTTSTVAAVADATGARLVVIDGDRSGRLPSAVWLDHAGTLQVGQRAIDQAISAAERYEPNPKAVIEDGAVLLGEAVIPMVEVLAAILERVASETAKALGDEKPARAVLAHPAHWGSMRTDLLREAAESIGLTAIDLVAEPAAAALRAGANQLQPGEYVAVCDFGGGTFDAAVLRRVERGIEVIGSPMTHDRIGGEAIDQRIIDYLGEGPIGRDPDWANLVSPPDLPWRRHAVDFRRAVRATKEGLSTSLVLDMHIPGLDREVQLSRGELEDLIRDDVREAIDLVAEAMVTAGIAAKELSAIYLVGGASRMPLVPEEIWNRFEQRPVLDEAPETTVALGATGWRSPRRANPPRELSGAAFRSRLAFATKTAFWSSGCQCYGYLTLTTADGTSATFADEPDPGGVERLANDAAERWRGSDGYEDLGLEPMDWLGKPGLRRWLVTGGENPEHRVERYSISQGRAITGSTAAESAAILDGARMAREDLDQTRFYHLLLTIDLAEGDLVTERLELIRDWTGHRVTAESFPLAAGTSLPDWAQRRVAGFSSLPGYEWKSQSRARMLAAPKNASRLAIIDGVPALVNTFRITTDATPLLTRVWTATVADRGYSVIATVPENERLGFRLLAAHATLSD